MSFTVTSTCSFPGNSDMYGPGIRIGFYLQWFSEILALWTLQQQIPEVRVANSLFTGATFIALVVQTAENKLRAVEMNIILLLVFASYFYVAPVYLWRIWRGPRGESEIRELKDFDVLNRGLMVSGVVFQIWFWIKGRKNAAGNECEEYGVFFGKVRLHGRVFVVANLLLYYFLLWCCVTDICAWVVKTVKRISKKEDKKALKARGLLLRRPYAGVKVAITSTVMAAVKLTIRWNLIENTSDVPTIFSACQLIPIAIGIGLVVRGLCFGMPGADNTKEKKDPRTISKSKFEMGMELREEIQPSTSENREIHWKFDRPPLTAYVPGTAPQRSSEFDRPSPPAPSIATEDQRQIFDSDFTVDSGIKAVLQRDYPWERATKKSSSLERRRSSTEYSNSMISNPSSPPPSARPRKSEFGIEVLPPDPVGEIPREKLGIRIWRKMKRS